MQIQADTIHTKAHANQYLKNELFIVFPWENQGGLMHASFISQIMIFVFFTEGNWEFS